MASPVLCSGDESHGPEPSVSGPICLYSVIAWLVTVAAWNSLFSRPVPDSMSIQFTDAGRMIFKPEYDLAIYVSGLLGALLLALGAAVFCHRQWQAAMAIDQRTRLQRWFNAHGWLALACVAYAAVWPQSAPVNLSVTGWAACVSIALWRKAKDPSVFKPAEHVLLASGPCPTPSAISGPFDNLRDSYPKDNAVRAAEVQSVSAARHPNDPKQSRSSGCWFAAAAAMGLIALLIYVPDPVQCEIRAWSADGLGHANFYLMGPLLAFRHGAALGTDSYVQYGVGWPLLFSLLARMFPISYPLVFETFTLCICVYFLLLFFFLQSLIGRPAWAIVGLLLAMNLQMFCGTSSIPLWVTPSSTILRNPLDLPVFWSCLRHARTGNSRYGILIGCLAGLSLLIGTDTGLYTIAALVFYCGLCRGFHLNGRVLLTRTFVVNVGLSFFVVAVTGLSWASRGTLLQSEFWRGYLEPLILYGGGIGALPMHDGLEYSGEFLLLMAALTTYSFHVVSAIFRMITRRLEATDLVMALVAAYGLGTMMLFINRSHPFNLYHPIIPFCILAAASIARLTKMPWRTVSSASKSTKILDSRLQTVLPGLLIAAQLFSLALNPDVWDYPSLLSHQAPARSGLPAELERASRALPSSYRASASYRREIEPSVEILQRLYDGGRHSVALIYHFDTVVLSLADVPPYFRYSPLELLHRGQVDNVERRLKNSPPEFVLWNIDKSDMQGFWTALFHDQYTVEASTQRWKVLRRKPSKP